MDSLNQKYSTTKLLTKEKPFTEKKQEDKFETILFLPENESRKAEDGLRTKGYFKNSYEDKPLVSIITVVFNGQKHLEQTIQSVINQTYDNVEYIIMDGGSTDGTLEIIEKYEDKIDYWVSEPDEGIYDAMNKGISLAQGDIIGLINSDDYYLSNTIKDIVKVMLESNVSIIYGDINMLPRDSGSELKVRKSSAKKLLFGMSLNHPATFVRRKIYMETRYDTAYKMAADYDFLLRNKITKKKFKYINRVLAVMRDDGKSVQLSQITRREERAIKKKLLPLPEFYIIQLIKTINALLKGR